MVKSKESEKGGLNKPKTGSSNKKKNKTLGINLHI